MGPAPPYDAKPTAPPSVNNNSDFRNPQSTNCRIHGTETTCSEVESVKPHRPWRRALRGWRSAQEGTQDLVNCTAGACQIFCERNALDNVEGPPLVRWNRSRLPRGACSTVQRRGRSLPIRKGVRPVLHLSL